MEEQARALGLRPNDGFTVFLKSAISNKAKGPIPSFQQKKTDPKSQVHHALELRKLHRYNEAARSLIEALDRSSPDHGLQQMYMQTLSDIRLDRYYWSPTKKKPKDWTTASVGGSKRRSSLGIPLEATWEATLDALYRRHFLLLQWRDSFRQVLNEILPGLRQIFYYYRESDGLGVGLKDGARECSQLEFGATTAPLGGEFLPEMLRDVFDDQSLVMRQGQLWRFLKDANLPSMFNLTLADCCRMFTRIRTPTPPARKTTLKTAQLSQPDPSQLSLGNGASDPRHVINLYQFLEFMFGFSYMAYERKYAKKLQAYRAVLKKKATTAADDEELPSPLPDFQRLTESLTAQALRSGVYGSDQLIWLTSTRPVMSVLASAREPLYAVFHFFNHAPVLQRYLDIAQDLLNGTHYFTEDPSANKSEAENASQADAQSSSGATDPPDSPGKALTPKASTSSKPRRRSVLVPDTEENPEAAPVSPKRSSGGPPAGLPAATEAAAQGTENGEAEGQGAEGAAEEKVSDVDNEGPDRFREYVVPSPVEGVMSLNGVMAVFVAAGIFETPEGPHPPPQGLLPITAKMISRAGNAVCQRSDAQARPCVANEDVVLIFDEFFEVVVLLALERAKRSGRVVSEPNEGAAVLVEFFRETLSTLGNLLRGTQQATIILNSRFAELRR